MIAGKKTICVYCASSANIDRQHLNNAFALGTILAERGSDVVCGAGNTGMMRALIDGANQAGGKTIGVIPRFMVDNNWHHKELGEIIVTDDMHQRKETMAKLADSIIALPGGCGTMEELLEIITWRQLGLYSGNIVILNSNDYYSPLLSMLQSAVDNGFMKGQHASLWQVAETPEQAVDKALSDIHIEIPSKY